VQLGGSKQTKAIPVGVWYKSKGKAFITLKERSKLEEAGWCQQFAQVFSLLYNLYDCLYSTCFLCRQILYAYYRLINKHHMNLLQLHYKTLTNKINLKLQSKPNQITWGTHLGETKLVASTTGNPEDTSLWINSTFTSVGTIFFSFCSPSLGPTSTIFTNFGIPFKNCFSK